MGTARPPRREAQFVTAPPSSAPEDSGTRREHTRHRVDLDVTVSSDHNFYTGFIENMSTGGIFVATHKVKPVGERLAFSITLPDSKQPITGEGEVRWVRLYSEDSNVEPGMGLRFTEISAQNVHRVQTFLAQREPIYYEDD
jgi:uncharacterized protein (TIGR02266 family)